MHLLEQPLIKADLEGNTEDAEREKAEADKGWHKWLSVEHQILLTNVLYGIFGVWLVLYCLCSFVTALQDFVPIVMLLLWVNLVGATVLVVGMVSTIDKIQKIGFGVLTFEFLLCWISPKHAVPILSGTFPCFILYLLIQVVWKQDVVDWGKFGVPTYMAMVGPGIGLINLLEFELWCSGFYPKLLYILFLPAFMLLTTYKEFAAAKQNNDLTGLDYKVSFKVFARLFAFRLAVLPIGIGYGAIWLQENLMDLMKDGTWDCTPLSW